MNHLRRNGRVYVNPVRGKMSRRCCICEAPIGHRCGSWRGYDKTIWTPRKSPHKER
jgi:hypothetical protein